MKLEIRRTNSDYRGRPIIKVEVKTEGWEWITTKDLLNIVKYIMESEDIRYPKEHGYKGRTLLFEAIKDIYEGKKTHLILNKTQTPRKLKYIHEIFDPSWKEEGDIEIK